MKPEQETLSKEQTSGKILLKKETGISEEEMQLSRSKDKKIYI
jgi:hypothetical protein